MEASASITVPKIAETWSAFKKTGQSINLDIVSQESFKIVLVYLIKFWKAYQGVSTNPSCLNTTSSTSPILILLLSQLVPSSHVGKGQDKTAALFPRHTFKLLTQERESGEHYKGMKVADERKKKGTSSTTGTTIKVQKYTQVLVFWKHF